MEPTNRPPITPSQQPQPSEKNEDNNKGIIAWLTRAVRKVGKVIVKVALTCYFVGKTPDFSKKSTDPEWEKKYASYPKLIQRSISFVYPELKINVSNAKTQLDSTIQLSNKAKTSTVTESSSIVPEAQKTTHDYIKEVKTSISSARLAGAMTGTNREFDDVLSSIITQIEQKLHNPDDETINPEQMLEDILKPDIIKIAYQDNTSAKIFINILKILNEEFKVDKTKIVKALKFDESQDGTSILHDIIRLKDDYSFDTLKLFTNFIKNMGVTEQDQLDCIAELHSDRNLLFLSINDRESPFQFEKFKYVFNTVINMYDKSATTENKDYIKTGLNNFCSFGIDQIHVSEPAIFIFDFILTNNIFDEDTKSNYILRICDKINSMNTYETQFIDHLLDNIRQSTNLTKETKFIIAQKLNDSIISAFNKMDTEYLVKYTNFILKLTENMSSNERKTLLSMACVMEDKLEIDEDDFNKIVETYLNTIKDSKLLQDEERNDLIQFLTAEKNAVFPTDVAHYNTALRVKYESSASKIKSTLNSMPADKITNILTYKENPYADNNMSIFCEAILDNSATKNDFMIDFMDFLYKQYNQKNISNDEIRKILSLDDILQNNDLKLKLFKLYEDGVLINNLEENWITDEKFLNIIQKELQKTEDNIS